MRSARWVGRVGSVCFEDQVLLRLVLDRGKEPLSGSLEVEDGGRREFVGVLELLALIDAVRAGGSTAGGRSAAAEPREG
jgi:hypothetical protein